MKKSIFKSRSTRLYVWISTLIVSFVTAESYAGNNTIGAVASNITESFVNVAKLITGGCYLAGLGFAVTAILKFKQHKDTPQQVTIGQPIAMVFIAAALLFLPSILNMAGYTMFGSEGGKTSGATGSVFESGS